MYTDRPEGKGKKKFRFFKLLLKHHLIQPEGKISKNEQTYLSAKVDSHTHSARRKATRCKQKTRQLIQKRNMSTNCFTRSGTESTYSEPNEEH